MSNTHRVYDTDLHFKIDPATRTIKNESEKLIITRYDHNSERFTFEIPRYVDGHDMSLCNRVQIHYLNVGTSEKNSGVYEVDDLQVNPYDEEAVICSWLISQNATQLVGSLNFVVRFACIAADNTIEYAWNTAIYSDIKISNGIYNGEEMVEQYPDIIEQWKDDLFKAASITHSWDGTVLTVTSASGTSSANLKGEKGDPGPKGEKGDPGDGSFAVPIDNELSEESTNPIQNKVVTKKFNTTQNVFLSTFITQVVCYEASFSDTNPYYTFPSPVELDPDGLYYAECKTYIDGVIQTERCPCVFSTTSDNSIQFLSDNIMSCLYVTSTGIANNWRNSGETMTVSIYKMKFEDLSTVTIAAINWLAGKARGGSHPVKDTELTDKGYVDRKITFGTTELTAGVSSLDTGSIYLVYEE